MATPGARCTPNPTLARPSAVSSRRARARSTNGWSGDTPGSYNALAQLDALESTGATCWPDFVFAFHDDDEVGPATLARIAKGTGLQSTDLQTIQIGLARLNQAAPRIGAGVNALSGRGSRWRTL